MIEAVISDFGGVITLPLNEAFARARSGRIDEAQSALALLMAEPRVRAYLAGRGRDDPS